MRTSACDKSFSVLYGNAFKQRNQDEKEKGGERKDANIQPIGEKRS